MLGNTTHSGLSPFGVVQPSHLRRGGKRAKGDGPKDEIMVLLSVSLLSDGFMFHLRPGPLCCFFFLHAQYMPCLKLQLFY